jgi:hypothetical protein
MVQAELRLRKLGLRSACVSKHTTAASQNSVPARLAIASSNALLKSRQESGFSMSTRLSRCYVRRRV